MIDFKNYSLIGLLSCIECYHYECIAGALEKNVAFVELKRRLEELDEN